MKTLYHVRWYIGVAITKLMLIGTILLLATSCTSLYDRAKARYAKTEADTTYQQVTVKVPKDSVVLRVVTDTNTVYREIRQGRATIIYQRDPRQTIVKAECDSILVEKRVPYIVEKQVWGVDPKFERRYWIVVAIAAGLGFFLLLIIGLGLLAYKFSKTYTVTKKDNGAPAVNPG